MSKRVINPHDKYFKFAMENFEVAQAFFKQHLPERILNLSDLNSLKLRKESFLSKNIELSASDVLFSVNVKDRPGYFYLLVEHQSAPDKWMPFRLMQYVFRVMDFHLKSHRPKVLPIVFPMMFYNGQKPYPYSMDLFDLFDDPADLAKDIMLKPFTLVDLHEKVDESQTIDEWLDIMSTLMKYVRTKDAVERLKQLARSIEFVLSKGGEDFIVASIRYVLEFSDLPDQQQLVEFLESAEYGPLSGPGGKLMTSLADQLRQQGMQQMAYRTIRRSLQQGFDLATIANITDMDINKVKKIIGELEKERA